MLSHDPTDSQVVVIYAKAVKKQLNMDANHAGCKISQKTPQDKFNLICPSVWLLTIKGRERLILEGKKTMRKGNCPFEDVRGSKL